MREKKEAEERKAAEEAAKGPDVDNLTPAKMKKLAENKDYSWLRAAADGTSKRCVLLPSVSSAPQARYRWCERGRLAHATIAA